MNFYHATLTNLDKLPLFARGSIPTIHASLTYCAWYGYWLASMTANPRDFLVYCLQEADRYLEAHVDGGFCVRDVGSFLEDDRSSRILETAPELFRKSWDWSGSLTYVPASCLRRLTLEEIQAGIKPEQWSYLSASSSLHLQFGGRPFPIPNRNNQKSKLAFPSKVPDFLRRPVAQG